MENPGSSERWSRAGIDDNMLTMFDASETKDAHQDALDDRIAFIDAVRASCEHGKPPTSKIFGAVFHMLRTGKSLELIVGSYKLLVDLDKHFPRVYLSGMDDSRSSSNSPSKLVVVKEAWSPIINFVDKAAAVSEVGDKQSGGSLDPSSFQVLIEGLAEILSETKLQAASMEPLRNMLIFQYLVVVFEDDFLPRKATLNWTMQRESLLSLLLVFIFYAKSILIILCKRRFCVSNQSTIKHIDLGTKYVRTNTLLPICPVDGIFMHLDSVTLKDFFILFFLLKYILSSFLRASLDITVKLCLGDLLVMGSNPETTSLHMQGYDCVQYPSLLPSHGSRKINYKSLMKDCMAIMCQLSQLQSELSKHPVLQESSESKLSKSCHSALSLALLEILKDTCVSMEKLLVMIMDLDMARKKADIEGRTTRADSPRTPLMDIILDELAYNKDSVPVFLKIVSEPKWKLEIVVQYLWKYITKPSIRTRKSNGHTEDATFGGALKCFSNKTGTKSLIKKIGVDVVQFLLAHGFQAHLSILSKGNAGDKQGRDSALVDSCQAFISAFDSLRSTDEHMEILSIGKEALFTAATIICVKS